MPARVREMGNQIKGSLEREWCAWEVDVLGRLSADAEKVRCTRGRWREGRVGGFYEIMRCVLVWGRGDGWV